MNAEKYAFESPNPSFVIYSTYGLGDAVLARKVIEAIAQQVPDCLIDIMYLKKIHRAYARCFYREIPNINRLISVDEYTKVHRSYDLALSVCGNHALIFDYVNPDSLKKRCPKFLKILEKIEEYNRKFVYEYGNWAFGAALRNMIHAEISGNNTFYYLSAGGTLPIDTSSLHLPLNPDYEEKFKELKLKNYITIYNDIPVRDVNHPKVKTWPLFYENDFVGLFKHHFPDIEVVQVGKGDVEIMMADRHYLNERLELTMHILANSLLHIGSEGGLIHLTTFLGTKCLVLFGPTSPAYYAYPQNTNIISKVCRPCVFTLPSFHECSLNDPDPNPPCMMSITPDMVFEAARYHIESLNLDFTDKSITPLTDNRE